MIKVQKSGTNIKPEVVHGKFSEYLISLDNAMWDEYEPQITQIVDSAFSIAGFWVNYLDGVIRVCQIFF